MLSLKRCLCIALLLLITIAANAQQSPPVTLKELLNRVDQRAPQLLTDSAAILIKKAQAVEVYNQWLPNLWLNYQADIGTSNNVIGAYFGNGVVPSSSSGIHNTNVTTAASTNLGIAALDWEFYNFGAYKAANKVASSDITVQQNQFATSKYDLRAYTISNYLQLLRLQDFIGIQYRDILRTQEILRSIRSLAVSGVKAGVDTSIATAELSKARLNYIEVNNQLKQVQLNIAAVSGVPYQSIIPDSTVEMALINQPAAYLFPLDTINHPLINFYRSVYENSLQREDLVKKEYNPKILLQAATWGQEPRGP